MPLSISSSLSRLGAVCCFFLANNAFAAVHSFSAKEITLLSLKGHVSSLKISTIESEKLEIKIDPLSARTNCKISVRQVSQNAVDLSAMRTGSLPANKCKVEIEILLPKGIDVISDFDVQEAKLDGTFERVNLAGGVLDVEFKGTAKSVEVSGAVAELNFKYISVLPQSKFDISSRLAKFEIILPPQTRVEFGTSLLSKVASEFAAEQNGDFKLSMKSIAKGTIRKSLQ